MRGWFTFIILFTITAPVVAETGYKLPRFVSLKSAEVNLRSGPGPDYPVLWVYKRRHLPVEIIEEYENWRKIKDMGGETGWVFRAMIVGDRHALIKSDEPLFKRPDATSQVVARLQKGVISKLETCRQDWCQLEIGEVMGWIKRSKIYGVYKDEEF